MSRGDRREDIFHDDVDRQDFLKTLGEACQKAAFEVPAYCLLRHHFHLVVETPQGNLVAGMRWLLSSYTLRRNHRRPLFGHVFSGRYKALVVDGRDSGYLKTVCDYVHLNPVRAKLLGQEDRRLSYPGSSFGWYLAVPAQRPGWLRVDRLLGEHGMAGDTPAGRREFERRMERRREEETDGREWADVRRGWCLGGEEFRRELLDRIGGRLGEHHSGELRRESAETKAERIIAEEFQRLGWTPADLKRRHKSDPEKLALAARLRAETTLTLKWIAARLRLGTRNSAQVRLQNLKHAKKTDNRRKVLV